MATPRVGLRFLAQSSALARPALRQPMTRQIIARRTQTTAAAPASEPSALSKLWNSHVGPKTVHFWAPVMKWGLVLAGISDFARPAESLSLTQNAALMATGCIWTRWCFVIRPQNYFLAAVNFFLFCVGSTQVARIFYYNQSLKNTSVTDEVKDAVKDKAELVKGIVQDPKGAVQAATKA